MNTNRTPETPAGISPADIYFVLFRHKWKIILLTLLGLAAATIFYFTIRHCTSRSPRFSSNMCQTAMR